MKIRQLPDVLANKIAAGEVVERPASVVKELVENSIDAESTAIQISLLEAGIKEIVVTDNGLGIEKEDCKNAFLRHATSKIHYDQDLFHIKSLGFRGEALASIASVSKLQLTSSTGKEAAVKLYLEGGKVVEEGIGDARKGTEVKVKELFYNTPARLKYMRSLHTELGHITDLINRYALAHPEIRFQVTHNGNTIFKTAGIDNRLQVIQQIYGTSIAKNMLAIKEDSLDFQIEGFIAKPEYTRANRNYITLIVNGRYIKSHALTHAIIRGYDNLLPIHRYPIAVISIVMDPILTDVNVHPTKMEIRFSKERELVDLVEHTIRQTFKSMTLIPEISKKPKEKLNTDQTSFAFEQQFTPKEKEISPREHTIERSFDNHPLPGNSFIVNTIRHDEMVQEVQEEKENNNNIPHKAEAERVPAMYPIGQLQGTYILAQNEQGFYMIDQHAAQERIKYEFYKKKLSEPAKDEQQLLMPLTFEFTNEEIMFIEQHQEQLINIGLYLENFGTGTYAVRSHPSWFPEEEAEQLIRDLINQVIHEGNINIKELRDEAAALMSCKRSIKANHYLTHNDMERLLNDLRHTEDPFTCPHGRPVIIHFTYYEIEKMFKRVM